MKSRLEGWRQFWWCFLHKAVSRLYQTASHADLSIFHVASATPQHCCFYDRISPDPDSKWVRDSCLSRAHSPLNLMLLEPVRQSLFHTPSAIEQISHMLEAKISIKHRGMKNYDDKYKTHYTAVNFGRQTFFHISGAFRLTHDSISIWWGLCAPATQKVEPVWRRTIGLFIGSVMTINLKSTPCWLLQPQRRGKKIPKV